MKKNFDKEKHTNFPIIQSDSSEKMIYKPNKWLRSVRWYQRHNPSCRSLFSSIHITVSRSFVRQTAILNLCGCITECYDIRKRWYVSTTVFYYYINIR